MRNRRPTAGASGGGRSCRGGGRAGARTTAATLVTLFAISYSNLLHAAGLSMECHSSGYLKWSSATNEFLEIVTGVTFKNHGNYYLQADAPVQDPATADDGDAPLPADDIDVDLDLLLSGSGTDEYYGDSAVRAPVNADIATNDGRCSAILPGLNALLSELQHSEEINVWPTVNHGGRQPAPEITCSEQGALQFESNEMCVAAAALFNSKLAKESIDQYITASQAGSKIDLTSATFAQKLMHVSSSRWRVDDLSARVAKLEIAARGGHTTSDKDLLAKIKHAEESAKAAMDRETAARTLLDDALETVQHLRSALKLAVSAMVDPNVGGLDARGMSLLLDVKADKSYVDVEIVAVNTAAVSMHQRIKENEANVRALFQLHAQAQAAARTETAAGAGAAVSRATLVGAAATTTTAKTASPPSPPPPPPLPSPTVNNSVARGCNCPDREDADPTECALVAASACGSLFGATNVSEFCPSLCNFTAAAAPVHAHTLPTRASVSVLDVVVPASVIIAGTILIVLYWQKIKRGQTARSSSNYEWQHSIGGASFTGLPEGFRANSVGHPAAAQSLLQGPQHQTQRGGSFVTSTVGDVGSVYGGSTAMLSPKTNSAICRMITAQASYGARHDLDVHA